MKTAGVPGHTVCPSRGGFARGAEFLGCGVEWGAGGPLPGSAQGAFLHPIPAPGPPRSGRAPCFPREAEERGKLASGGKGWEDTMVLTEHRTCVSELHAAPRRQSSRRRRTRPKRGGPAGRGGAAEPGRRSAELAAEIKKGSRAISNSRNLKRG